MKLTNYQTGQYIEINADSVIEIHSRGKYTEITAGIDCDGIELTEVKKVTETVPEVISKIREEKTS